MPETARVAELTPDAKVERTLSEESEPERRPHPANLQARILYQQKTIGNRAVQRLIKSGSLHPPTKTTPPAWRKTQEPNTDSSSRPIDRQTSEPSPPVPSRSGMPEFQIPRATTQAGSASAPTFPKQAIHATQSAGRNQVHRAWYNFSIPFTDYEFDPSLEGLKTAGNLAVDKAKQGATWVKDKVVAAAEWVAQKIESVIHAGIEWLTGKFDEIKEFAKSSFADVKGAVSSALGAITSPLGAITTAISTMDAGILSAAWRALTAGANAAWQTAKTAVNGVLSVGGGIWETVSKYVDWLFSTVGDLLDSDAFNLLPDVVQAPIKGLYNTVRDLWTSIRDFWTDLWKRLTSFVKGLLDSIQGFVQKVVSYAIDKVIETVTKLKEVYDFIQRFVHDPESVLKPIIASIAGKIKAEAPGKSKEVAQQKSGEAWASRQSSQTSTAVVHRSPDGGAETRSTTTRDEVDKNLNRELAAQWAALDIPKMLWDTVVNTFWPPATIRAIGHEFYELWNTDWKNAASSLFAPRNIFDDFVGFWHDVWSNFLVLLDFPLALWRRLNSILTLLMGYVTIILVLVGLVGGAIAGGGVPGAMAGAWAGAQLAWAIGEALFLSFFLAESSSALKAFLALYTARQTEIEKQREYVQIAASVIGMGVAIVIALLFSLLGVLAREIVGRIKARGGGAPKELPPGKGETDTDPSKQEPKPEAETVPGKAALEADVKTAQADATALRDTIKQTTRAEERAPLDARAAEIQQKLARLQEDAGRATNADDVQRGRQQLQDLRNDLDALRKDAKVAEVPGRLSLQQDISAAKLRSASLRQSIDALTGNDQRTLRPQLDTVDAELGRLEQRAQNVPTMEQAQRLREALDSANKSMDDIAHHPLLELGLRGEVLDALESLENIKKDPVGDINKEISEQGNPKNHYEAARREARGEVVSRGPDGTPYDHIGDLQRAYDGLDNVRRALQREMDHPLASITDRGLNVLLNKFSEVQGIMSRLKGFLDSIGQGNFPPYHTFPPGT